MKVFKKQQNGMKTIINLIFMIVLITGSAGYIGKNLYNFLIENGFKVFGLDKKKNKLLECDIQL